MKRSWRFLETRRSVHSSRRLCLLCHRRTATFRYRGLVKADRSHTLCQQCFRSLADRLKSNRLLRGGWVVGPRTQSDAVGR